MFIELITHDVGMIKTQGHICINRCRQFCTCVL